MSSKLNQQFFLPPPHPLSPNNMSKMYNSRNEKEIRRHYSSSYCPVSFFKGTASLDIGLHFRFWKIKLVFSAGPLMVLTFAYFTVPEIFKN
jgi:hypothetical protein